MKRKDDEKERFRLRSASSRSRSKVDLIPLELKMATLTGSFLIKTHQKELFFRVERLGTALTVKELDCNDNEEDEKDNRSRSKVDLIPLDLQVEILTRLPGKSVLKFRCVSKMWSSITRSQRFINSFFSMSSTRSRFIIILSNGVFAKEGDKRLFIFLSSHEAEDSSSLVANLDIIIPSGSLDHGSKSPSVHGFVGCCYEGHFTICNPTTRQVIRVPCKGPHTSFGYDSVGDQFKALTMVTSPDQNPSFKVHEVITLGGGGESRNEVTTALYYPVTKGVCINGFVYYGAWAPRQRMNPVIVCFDVRYERLSFIKAPKDVVVWETESVLIEYKGKLASIVRYPFSFRSFDLWILEDGNNQDWSKQTFELPFSLVNLTSPGTTKAGEIIFAPKTLSRDFQPFYIFYYNVERKTIRRVEIQGIADNEEFRRRYGLVEHCCVSISPEHVESVASL